MKEIFIVSFIFVIGYRIGHKVGSDTPSRITNVNLSYYKDARMIDTWFFPCTVINIEIVETEDESLSIELNEILKQKLVDKSTVIKHCYTPLGN